MRSFISYIQFLLLSHKRLVIFWVCTTEIILCVPVFSLYIAYIPSGNSINFATILTILFMGAPYYAPVPWYLLCCLLILGPTLLLSEKNERLSRQITMRVGSHKLLGLNQLISIFFLIAAEFLVIVVAVAIIAEILGSNHSMVIDDIHAIALQTNDQSETTIHLSMFFPFFVGFYITTSAFCIVANILNKLVKHHAGTIVSILSIFLCANMSQLPSPALDMMIIRSIFGLGSSEENISRFSFLPVTALILIVSSIVFIVLASSKANQRNHVFLRALVFVKWFALYWKQIVVRLICIAIVTSLALSTFYVTAKYLMGIGCLTGDWFIFALLGAQAENQSFTSEIASLLQIPYLWILLITLVLSSHLGFPFIFFKKQMLMRFDTKSSAFLQFVCYYAVILFGEIVLILMVCCVFTYVLGSHDALLPLVSEGSAYQAAYLASIEIHLDQLTLVSMLSSCLILILLFALSLAAFSLIFDRLQVILVGIFLILPSIFLSFTVLPADHMMLAKYIQAYVRGAESYSLFMATSVLYGLIYIASIGIAHHIYIHRKSYN